MQKTSKENEKTQKKILNTSIIKISGLLMFIGAVQWFFVILLAEGLHPGYNSATHYVSSLGVGVTALFYNTSVILLGLTTVVGTYLLHGSHSSRAFTILLSISGLATLGVGIFPENVRPIHGIVTPIALIFGGLSAIWSYRIQTSPLRYIAVLLGAGSIFAGFLFNPYLGLPRESLDTFLGLGKGTMERLIIYPILLWIIGFGSSLTERASEQPRSFGG
jgi:hypothetical membrane protein